MSTAQCEVYMLRFDSELMRSIGGSGTATSGVNISDAVMHEAIAGCQLHMLTVISKVENTFINMTNTHRNMHVHRSPTLMCSVMGYSIKQGYTPC